MADRKCPVFYYSSTSYYSQIALLALFEKDVCFKRVFVDISSGEQNEPWYIRLNRKGVVPTLKDGDKIVPESRAILDYVDSEFNSGIKLVPSLESRVGKDVSRWRGNLQDIRVDQLTYGIMQNPELSKSGIKLPWISKYVGLNISKDDVAKKVNAQYEKIKMYAEKYPDVRDALLAKAEARRHPGLNYITKETVEIHYNNVDSILDQVENQLQTSRAEYGVPDVWLVSPRFTAADIYLAVLLDRCTFLGLDDLHLNEHKRPLLFDYYNRLGKRKNIQTLRGQFYDMIKHLFWGKVKSVTPFVLVTALAYVAFKTKLTWLKMLK